MRATALAWCARLLSQEMPDRARELLNKSKELGTCGEATLAEAFLIAASDKDAALALLAGLNTAAARTAAIRILTNKDGPEAALSWAASAGLSIELFDADGKFVHIMNELSVGRWEHAINDAAKITEKDFRETPVLSHPVGMSYLIQAIPEELRALVLSQVPFEASQFPLAADAAALHARRCAITKFDEVSAFAISVGVAAPSNPASDYALWLKLRDLEQRTAGLDELRANMRDPQELLCRLHFALQFGIKLDIASIEKEIDRRVALAGKGTADDAFARFSLAFVQGTPKAVAEYIAKHRAQLYDHLVKSGIQTLEIKMLARAGSLDAAKERLTEATAEGLGEREQEYLRRVISESEGADPAAECKSLYERSGHLADLVQLVNFLEQREDWQELLPFAEKLFATTHSVEDAFRVAQALNGMGDYTKLLQFLLTNRVLVDQALVLKSMLAWSFYRDGQFEQAASLLSELRAAGDDQNNRALGVNLAIASGNWDRLVEHCIDEWRNRDKRSAAELLAAAQLAQAVGAPHARELVTAAVDKAPNDPNILASAYFVATSAGWEQTPQTAQWITKAAALSDEGGPIKSVSMRELMAQKPDWDRRETSVWTQLNEGKIPVFGAAHILNRSLIDFVLLQSLANLTERDPRKRSIVYAFSGARPASTRVEVQKIAKAIGSR